MEKTFRTCKRGYLLEWCEPHCTPVWCESCESYKPRETPLLVDQFAEAITSALVWLRKIDQPSDPLWSTNIDYAIDDLELPLARYKEEVGDA